MRRPEKGSILVYFYVVRNARHLRHQLVFNVFTASQSEQTGLKEAEAETQR